MTRTAISLIAGVLTVGAVAAFGPAPAAHVQTLSPVGTWSLMTDIPDLPPNAEMDLLVEAGEDGQHPITISANFLPGPAAGSAMYNSGEGMLSGSIEAEGYGEVGVDAIIDGDSIEGTFTVLATGDTANFEGTRQ
ncbi:MAG: hypothetical protein AAFR38_03745 [Planctomycetota bacterium]